MNPLEQRRITRPTFLSVLCILTFISCGFSLIFFILGLIGGPPTVSQIEALDAEMLRSINMMREEGANNIAQMFEQFNIVMSYRYENYWKLLVIEGIAAATGLAGAIMMWKGRKTGFHLYIIYNIIMVLAVYFAVPIEHVPAYLTITNIVFSLIFILMYSRNLKWMK